MASNQTKTKTYQEENGKKARKRKQKEEKKTSTKVLTFFLILITIGILMGILCSPAFNLTDLIVEKGENVTKQDIANSVNVNYGENILKQNYKILKQDVLALPYISDVNIKIRFPDKIKIEYTEREQYAYIKFLDSYYVVDKYGNLLEILKDINENKELPIIYGIDVTEYSVGEKLNEIALTKFKDIVILLETAKVEKFKYTINEINYESISKVKVWVKEEDVEIIYGNIEKNLISEKLVALEQMLKKLNGRKGRLDVSDEEYYKNSIFSDLSDM